MPLLSQWEVLATALKALDGSGLQLILEDLIGMFRISSEYVEVNIGKQLSH
jgi:hypothetical protein